MAAYSVFTRTIDGTLVSKTESLEASDAWALFSDVVENTTASIVVEMIQSDGIVVARELGEQNDS